MAGSGTGNLTVDYYPKATSREPGLSQMPAQAVLEVCHSSGETGSAWGEGRGHFEESSFPEQQQGSLNRGSGAELTQQPLTWNHPGWVLFPGSTSVSAASTTYSCVSKDEGQNLCHRKLPPHNYSSR